MLQWPKELRRAWGPGMHSLYQCLLLYIVTNNCVMLASRWNVHPQQREATQQPRTEAVSTYIIISGSTHRPERLREPQVRAGSPWSRCTSQVLPCNINTKTATGVGWWQGVGNLDGPDNKSTQNTFPPACSLRYHGQPKTAMPGFPTPLLLSVGNIFSFII